ncbi:MAG: cytochrome b/b6 domain-containing protein [Usitatibacter sp.]
MPEENHVAIKVWDLPVRLFHWVLVVLFVFQVVSGKIGGNMMDWHAYSGYSVLVLVIFRILWGFAGGTHARFASFLAGPAATARFARRLFSREAVPQVGHNPLGGWSVIVMVMSLALQATSGLFANDGAEFEGPLAALVSFDVSTGLTHLHRWNLKVLLVLAGLHVAAVLFHWLVKKDNLMGAMFTGVKRVPEAAVRERREALRDTPLRRAPSREDAAAYFGSSWRALALFVVALVFVYLIVQRPF